jgi:tetratricopeptide (TPR) repeat protein
MDARLTGRMAAVSIAIALAALVLSFWFVLSLRAEVARLARFRDQLKTEVERSRAERDSLAAALRSAREAVSATRSAIPAFGEGDYAEAVDYYSQALAEDSTSAYLHNLRGYALFKLGRLDEAIAEARASVDLDPQYAWGYLDLARFLCAAGGQDSEARLAIRAAISLRPQLRHVMLGDAEFMRTCGRMHDELVH